jgi:hypothetical protein
MESVLEQTKSNLETMWEVWRNDPCRFFVDVLGIEESYIWDKMREIAESVRDNERTVVPAGHSVSKTFTAGQLAVWFMSCFPPATVITTAPTDKQVEHLLWREIRQAHANARIPLGGKMSTKKWDLQEETGLKWYALGFATKPETVTMEATAFQGYHNEHVLVIFDEAAGIPKEIWKATKHLFTTGFWRFLAIGNPTSAMGDFADALDDETYNVINISVKDTPNFKSGKELIPGVAGRSYEADIRRTYGESHREYKIRILGQVADYAVDGSYYATILKRLRRSSPPHITEIEYNPSYPVHTVWDNGYTTGIWFFQQVGQRINVLRYYEDSGPGIEEYIDLLRGFGKDLGYRYGRHFAPFDVDSNAQRAVIGKTIRETAEDFDFIFKPLPIERSVLEGVERTRKFLNSCWFDLDNCKVGLDNLMSYHERKNIRMSTDTKPHFVGVPEHDTTSHAADGMRYMSLAVTGDYLKDTGVSKEHWQELKTKYGY